MTSKNKWSKMFKKDLFFVTTPLNSEKVKDQVG